MSELSLPFAGTWISRSAHGAASELRACAALMDAGYHVFRAESPQSPFDLVAYRGGELLRVEVKSMTSKEPRHAPAFSWPKNLEWDILVVVAEDRVFCFDAGTSQPEATDVVRVHYGFAPISEYLASRKGLRVSDELCARVLEITDRGCSIAETARLAGISEYMVGRIRQDGVRIPANASGDTKPADMPEPRPQAATGRTGDAQASSEPTKDTT